MASSVQGFLAPDAPDVFETVTGLYGTMGRPLTLRDDMVVEPLSILGLEALDEKRNIVYYHDPHQIRSVDIVLSDQPGSSSGKEVNIQVEPPRSFRFKKDITTIEAPYPFDRIEKAVKMGPCIHLVHKGEEQVDCLKTFVADSDDSHVFRDTGNRRFPMDILEEGQEVLSRQFILRQSVLREIQTDPFEQVSGKIYDIIPQGVKDFFAITWENEKSRAHIYHLYGAREPQIKKDLSFKFSLAPGALAYCKKWGLFFFSAMLQNDLYCISCNSLDEPRVITTALDLNGESFVEKGRVEDLFAGQIGDVPVLIVAQAESVRLYFIKRILGGF